MLLNYNKVGRSMGVATIIFQKATSASEAAKQYDGVKVDGKPMKVRMHASDHVARLNMLTDFADRGDSGCSIRADSRRSQDTR